MPDGAGSRVDDTPTVQWAPTQPKTKKSRKALWIGIPVGVVAVGAVAASLVLIAPGTAVAGVPVGFMTEAAAADAVSARLASTTVTLGDGGVSVSGADLGASVDASALASQAFGERPMWNVTQWFGDASSAEIALDAEKTAAALKAAAPDSYIEPVAAAVTFVKDAYVVTPAVAGQGIDPESVRAALQEAFVAGESNVTVEPGIVALESPTTTEAATGVVDSLNATLSKVGFYVDDERTVAVAPATASTWLSVTVGDDGAFSVSADETKIQATVDQLAEKIDQKAVNGSVVTNESGDVLKTITEGQDGRVLGDTSDVAAAFATQLETGNGAYVLPVSVTTHTMSEVVRTVEVDLGEQRVYLKENGAVIDSWAVSTGRAGADTHPGRYNIGWKTPVQDMSGTTRDSGTAYTQENVKWVMYFNGNQAIHGVYWHNNWGTRMSAGCVGMPEHRAEQIYRWAPSGADVHIHG